ncbi:potassium channel family protein [Fulvivirga sedimenti]|uniref:Potassium channel protein n=1 Tax=Fulvivirga sedimenti TaxID=2879465 RepID=A0A9X1HUF1_9BACT|nr:potassium channel protein [Fulvivirga sedimenti]MCA6078489.1 potassium channel protein [Fulvivirga sedimenti]
MPRSIERIFIATFLFFLSIIGGTIGYVVIEGYGIVDAAYMAVITFSTVGFTEVNPLSDIGKIFTTGYIVVNLAIFAYSVSVVSSFLFEGELQKIFKNLKSSREVKKLNQHVIVCGFGKNGAQACEELYAENRPFVVVERDPEVIKSFSNERNYMFINGNATMDEVLEEAGIVRASTVITALPNDADNVFITLTARGMNQGIRVIAKASEANSETKLYRAGAEHVVMPDRLGGIHMANLVTKPVVIEFLELLNGVGEEKLMLEEVPYSRMKDEFHDLSLKDLNIRQRTGVTVIAFKDDVQGFIFNPHSDKIVSEGDTMIILGRYDQIHNFLDIYLKH